MFDSYEYTDPMYINKHQFYHRHGWCTTDEDVQRWKEQETEDEMSQPSWYMNLQWMIERLRLADGIRYEDLNIPEKKLGKYGHQKGIKVYKGIEYDCRNMEDVVRLYEAITGNPQKIVNLDDYIAERRKKHEERTELGTDRKGIGRKKVGDLRGL